MSERLLHYGREPVLEVRDVTEQTDRWKPRGLWVSVDDEWAEWCRGEDFHTEALEVVTEVVLAREANVLWLRGADELDEFTLRYTKDEALLPRAPFELDMIDWARVAGEYQGIVIAPYVWSRRLELMWYYGWDCASGCIWDAKGVAELRQNGEVNGEHQQRVLEAGGAGLYDEAAPSA